VVRIKCEGGKSIIFEFVNNRGIEVSTKWQDEIGGHIHER
jgi:hypothetical protein